MARYRKAHIPDSLPAYDFDDNVFVAVGVNGRKWVLRAVGAVVGAAVGAGSVWLLTRWLNRHDVLYGLPPTSMTVLKALGVVLALLYVALVASLASAWVQRRTLGPARFRLVTVPVVLRRDQDSALDVLMRGAHRDALCRAVLSAQSQRIVMASLIVGARDATPRDVDIARDVIAQVVQQPSASEALTRLGHREATETDR